MTLCLDDLYVSAFVDSKYSCGWSTVVTQAAVYKIGSNFGLHLIRLIAMKSMVSAEGCLQIHFTRYQLKSESN